MNNVNEEKPKLQKIRFWLPYILFVVLAFVLGMQLQKSLLDSKYYDVLDNYVKDTNLKIQEGIHAFNFSTATWTRNESNSSVCIKAELNETIGLFYDVIVPALNRQPVCFVSIYEPSEEQEVQNEYIQQ